MNIFDLLRKKCKLHYSYNIKEFVNNVKTGTLPAHMTGDETQMKSYLQFCQYIDDTWHVGSDGGTKKNLLNKLRFN